MKNIILFLCFTLLIYYFYCNNNLNKNIDNFTSQEDNSISNKINMLVNKLDDMKREDESNIEFNENINIRGELKLKNINFKNNTNILPVGSITSFYGYYQLLIKVYDKINEENQELVRLKQELEEILAEDPGKKERYNNLKSENFELRTQLNNLDREKTRRLDELSEAFYSLQDIRDELEYDDYEQRRVELRNNYQRINDEYEKKMNPLITKEYNNYREILILVSNLRIIADLEWEMERKEKIINDLYLNGFKLEKFEKQMIPRNWVYCNGKYYKRFLYLNEDEENKGLNNLDDIREDQKYKYIKTPNLINSTVFGIDNIDNYTKEMGQNNISLELKNVPNHNHRTIMNARHDYNAFLYHGFQKFENILTKDSYISSVGIFGKAPIGGLGFHRDTNYVLFPPTVDVTTDENGEKVLENVVADKFDSSIEIYNLYDYKIESDGNIIRYTPLKLYNLNNGVLFGEEIYTIYDILFIGTKSLKQMFKDDMIFYSIFSIYVRTQKGIRWLMEVIYKVYNLTTDGNNFTVNLKIPSELKLIFTNSNNKINIEIPDLSLSGPNYPNWYNQLRNNDNYNSLWMWAFNSYLDENKTIWIGNDLLSNDFVKDIILGKAEENYVNKKQLMIDKFQYQLIERVKNDNTDLKEDSRSRRDLVRFFLFNDILNIQKNDETITLSGKVFDPDDENNYISYLTLKKFINDKSDDMIEINNLINSSIPELQEINIDTFIYSTYHQYFNEREQHISFNVSPKLTLDFRSVKNVPISNLPPNKSLVWIMKI